MSEQDARKFAQTGHVESPVRRSRPKLQENVEKSPARKGAAGSVFINLLTNFFYFFVLAAFQFTVLLISILVHQEKVNNLCCSVLHKFVNFREARLEKIISALKRVPLFINEKLSSLELLLRKGI